MAQSAHQHSIESENMNDESALLPSSHLNRIDITRITTTNADNREQKLSVAPKKSYELPSGMLLSCRIFIYRINTTK
jgi:hypothetical protein